MEALQVRKDGSHLDFEQVTIGSLIFVERDHIKHTWYSTDLHFKVGDIWLVAATLSRPRFAILRNLQRGESGRARVDELLELDDQDIITIGPA